MRPPLIKELRLNKRVALIQGGLSSEREISLQTGEAFDAALRELGYEYTVIDANEDLPKVLTEIRPKVDVALLALHGKLAEDGVVQGICEYLRLPYTGSGVLGSSVGFDKILTKQILSYNNIPTAKYRVINAREPEFFKTPPPFDFPLVVKPSREGSSVGISVCKSAEEWPSALKFAAEYDYDILVEEFLDGKELTVPILVDRALVPIEIRPKQGFYDYKNKYTAGNTEYIMPPEISESLILELKSLGLRTHELLRAKVYSRVDFRLHHNKPYVMEINTLPGCTPTSLVPKAAAYEGVKFSSFIQTLIEHAGLDYEGLR